MIGNLVRDRLPLIVPAATAAQTSAPVAEVETATEAENAEKSPSFEQLQRLLNDHQWDDADRTFEKTKEQIEREEIKYWFRCYYLKEKAVRGHRQSLAKLREMTEKDPSSSEPWEELSEYYGELGQNREAAELLLRGSERVRVASKSELLRRAATAYSKDKDYSTSYAVLRRALGADTDSESQRVTLRMVADVAKRQKDVVPEAAVLEKSLDLDPADGMLRFRLAYLYAQMGKHGMAVYHYRLRLAQEPDPLALNNLGVAFRNLGLKAKEVEMFATASTQSTLAKANLGHAYLDRGFLNEAESLARGAMKDADGDTARTRAAEAIELASNQRTQEREREDSIVAEAKSESAFRARYAEAFTEGFEPEMRGSFETSHGIVEFFRDGTLLRGHGELLRESKSAVSMLLAGSADVGAKSPDIKRTINVTGHIRGRAATFEIEFKDQFTNPPKLPLPSPPKVSGLLIVSRDEKSLEILEEGEKSSEIHHCKRVDIPQGQ